MKRVLRYLTKRWTLSTSNITMFALNGTTLFVLAQTQTLDERCGKLYLYGPLGLQWSLFQEQAAGFLGIIQVVTGWPATIALLVVSYLYGTWRLRYLKGPSVEEFKAGAEPPWTGQRRGF
jgi:hypothetical protein